MGMIRGFLWVLLAVASVGFAADEGDVPDHGKVVKVIDGDTLVLDSGEHVRLLDINTTEVSHHGEAAQEGSAEGAELLTKLTLGKEVRLEFGPRKHDVYKRVLAHLYLPDGTWVNGAMVASGWAHVYTFPDNNVEGDKLIVLEDKARAAKKGLWALPRWQVIDADKCCSDEEIGRFELVKGKVLKATEVDGRTYLNFGRDWKTDFTVLIPKKSEKVFRKQGITDFDRYVGKTVLVRGFTEPVNGVTVRVTHPQQMEVLQ